MNVQRSQALRPAGEGKPINGVRRWINTTSYASSSNCAAKAMPSRSYDTIVEQRQPAVWQRPVAPQGEEVAVALGKFDAMHVGHRALAARAAELGGHPYLLSFSGMAEVLGWPPRLPLVATYDRPRVLQTWASACCGLVPRQLNIPFADIRSLPPEEFVRILAQDLQVSGVVVGSNYRFGYKAAGDAELLQRCGSDHGLKVAVVDLLTSCEATGQQVSSSQIRAHLREGEMRQVAEMLERPYRLVAAWQRQQQPAATSSSGSGSEGCTIRLPASSYQSLPPAAGRYEVQVHTMQAGQCIWGSQNCFEPVGSGVLQLLPDGLELVLPGAHDSIGDGAEALLLAMDFEC